MGTPVVIINPGFEDNSVGVHFNEFTFGPPAGWSLHDPLNITNEGAGNTYYTGTLTPFQPDPVGNPGVYANFPDGAAEGQRVAIAFNFAGSGNQGEYGIRQTLAATLEPITQYTLEVEIGNIASATAMDGTYFALEGIPGYRVDLIAGGVIIAQDLNALAGSIDDGEFGTSSVTFTTGPTHPQLGQQLGIRLVNLNQIDPSFPNSHLEVDFDDARLDASPAPGGDYNLDGATDAADYVVWRRVSGSPEAYDIWRANYGVQSGSGSRSLAASVPEPHGLVLFAFCSFVTLRTRTEGRH
jgi:hypothetical protein